MAVFKMSSNVCSVMLLLTCIFSSIGAANILFFMGLSTYSHRILVWPLVERLVDKRHNVTFYQPIKPKTPHPKVTEYFPDSLATYLEEMEPKVNENDFLTQRLAEGRQGIQRSIVEDMPLLAIKYCEAFLSAPELDNLLQTPFDLVIIDSLINECAYGVAYKLRAKTIVFGTSTISPQNFDAFGFPHENSWVPDMYASELIYPLTFSDRVFTTLLPLLTKYQREVNYFSKLEKMLREKLKIPEMPDLVDLERETSLLLVNTHFSEEYARSLPPFVVSIGGIHCPDENFKAKPLPEEIESFITDAGDDGFIYVSFGTGARISEAPKWLQNVFFDAFRMSKIRFLWKWEGQRPKEMPNNVLTVEWMPQLDILARGPKAFIMHGGLLGIQEAIRFETPMIVMPIFAEQDYNAFRIDYTKRGIQLDIGQLTVEILASTISWILTNPAYKENMKETARLFNDRPMKPVDEATWWIEYVLRNNNTSHMKPLAMNQYWFQRRLLDVWLFISFILMLVILFVIYLSRKLFTFVISLVLGSKRSLIGNSAEVKRAIKSKKSRRS